MKRVGFLIVDQRTGYVQEGRDHAAKLFEGLAAARKAAKPMTQEVPVQLPYDDLIRALLKGSSFCFESEEGYNRFLTMLRNDPGNRPFMAYSKDRTLIKWRHAQPKLTDQFPLPEVSPQSDPVTRQEPPIKFNAALLVK